MQPPQQFATALKTHAAGPHPLVPFNKETDTLLRMDFTEGNNDLTDELLRDTKAFAEYIRIKLQNADAAYGIGGYNEHRTIYRRSPLFGDRCLHLGIDIWGAAGTAVYAPLAATVHSFGFNDAFGDFGGTIILQHWLAGFCFHSLYGHLSLASVQHLHEGLHVAPGQQIAAFGAPAENGQWPPHLHFQIILNMQGRKGDYPGVCALAEQSFYLANCPDPDLMAGLMALAKAA